MYNSAYRYSLGAILAFISLGFGISDAHAQIPLGSTMPGQNVQVTLPDGSTTTLGALKGADGTLVVFWGNRCPWIGKIEDRLKSFAGTFSSATRKIILINSNDGSAFAAESRSGNAEAIAGLPQGIPYVADAEAAIMEAFAATRSPEFFLFDASDALVYTGSMDDSPGDADKVTKSYLADAYAAMSSGNAVRVGVTKPFGCMIKPKR
ncbi:MAG: redoxin family protein [Rhodothermales bacterium]|nr:redoxin family protein [Rhodothermales bacterium]